MKIKIVLLLILFLSSCAPDVTTIPTITILPTDPFTLVSTPSFTLTPPPLFTVTPTFVTETPPHPTVLPTQMMLTAIAIAQTQEWTFPVITPEPAELERWREYEEALGNAIYERVQRTDIICEWQIVGRADREVYVWVACSGFRPFDSKLTTFTQCAVVYLGADGEVQGIGTIENTSGSSYGDIRRKLFPPGIYERCVHTPADRMKEHLESRRENSEPPLFVLDATETP